MNNTPIRIYRKIYNYHFSPEKEFVRRLHAILGFTPVNVAIFRLAFSHKSSLTDPNEYYATQNNERLEYLGDAVLGTIVAEYLFRKYPNKDEGFLTKMRSKMVNRKMLNEVGEKMGLDAFLLDSNNTNKLSRTMLGNALEAFVGAVYLDIGYYATREYVINRIVREQVDVAWLETYDDNFKSQLLEWSQKNRKSINYDVVEKKKVDNRDFFVIAVKIDDVEIARSEDFSKKSAEQKASKEALFALHIIRPLKNRL